MRMKGSYAAGRGMISCWTWGSLRFLGNDILSSGVWAVQSIMPDFCCLVWLFSTKKNLLFLELPILLCFLLLFWGGPDDPTELPFIFGPQVYKETRAPFCCLTGHTMGEHMVCSVAEGRVPRQLWKVKTAEDTPWAVWTGLLSFGGPGASGFCVYLPGGLAHLAPVCSLHSLTGDGGGEVVECMALCVFGSLGRLGTEIRASGRKHV